MFLNTQLYDTFFTMLSKPAFGLHISVKAGLYPSQRMVSVRGLVDSENQPLDEGVRREVAGSIARLFAVNGLYVSRVIMTPEEGLLEVDLNPLATKNASSEASSYALLESIVNGTLYEVEIRRLVARTDDDWINAFGLANPDTVKVYVGLNYATRLYTVPDLYQLHQIHNPEEAFVRDYGEAFASAVEKVVYTRINGGWIPEQAMCLPLDKFKKLAKQFGFNTFIETGNGALLVEKRA